MSMLKNTSIQLNTNQQTAKIMKRFDEIDFLKGIGAILVILGHMQYTDQLKNLATFIYGFHMPLFFWISGNLYKKPALFGEYVIKKAKSILIPYCFFGLLYCFFSFIIEGREAGLKGLVGVCFKVVRDIPIEIGLWFLPVLFLVSCLFAFIDLDLTNTFIKNSVITIISITGFIIVKQFHYLPFGISSALPCIAFFATGYYFNQYIDFVKKVLVEEHRCLLFVISLLIIFGVLIMSNGKISVRMGNYGFSLLAYISSMVYSFCFLILSLLICSDSGDLRRYTNFKSTILFFIAS